MTATHSTPLSQLPASEYGELLAAVRSSGLLRRSVLGYVPRLLCLLTMSAAGVVLFIWLGNSRWQLALAAYSGIVITQLAFLGHDAGHQQLSTSRALNDRVGIVLSALCVGLSYGWWVDKHNRHHRNPNQVGMDPDVERGILAWTESQAQQQRGIFRRIARHERSLFFPLLLLEGWNLHVSSIRSLTGKPPTWRREATLLTLHAVLGLSALLIVVSPLRALEFILVQQSVFGLYVGCSFAPNHKGMPIIEGPAQAEDFLRRQVVTSRDISGGRPLAALFGSLNYQIEHHLFPSMPSRNLRRCQPMVRRFCVDHLVPYTETGLVESYRISLRYLHSLCPTAPM